MADRKSSLLSRFWPPSSTRRTSTTAPPPPPATTTSTPRAETKAPARQSTTTTSPPAATTPPRTQPRKADQPSGEVQKASSQQTTTPSTESKDKSKASSPSRLSPQSRSPPPPPKPPSPSRLTSGSPKQRPSSSSPKPKLPASSPSKETISATHEAPTSTSKERDPEPAAPQQPEVKVKEEAKPDSTKLVESLDSSSINGGHEASTALDAKPELVQPENAEANEETTKEVINSSAPKSVKEELEAIDTKEILATAPTDAAASQPTERSSNLRVRDKSAPENEEQVQLNNQMAQGESKKAISSDKPVNVIMLAGENRGASMQMESKSSKREEPIHIHRSYKTNPDESPEAATTDAEEIPEEKKPGDERSMEDQLMEAYVNNNAQGINNSIVFNSSIVEGNPGVHMVVNHLPKEAVQSKDATSGTETRRAEVNMSRAEKLTYQPTVRRRCLRGLLLETSDSDSDSEKPRRHGCRVGCQKGDRENNIDVS